MDDWLLGTIPWSVDGMAEVLSFLEALQAKPKDDWDFTDEQYPIDFENQFKSASGFHADHQVIGFLMRKHDGNVDLVRAHSFRWTLVKEFYKSHGAQLLREGLIMQEGPNLAISPRLVHALATAPFSEDCTRSGTPSRRFSISEILRIEGEVKDE